MSIQILCLFLNKVICVFFISFFVSFLVLLRVMDFASLVRESVFDVIDYVCFLFCWFFSLSVLFPSYYIIGILFALLFLPSFFSAVLLSLQDLSSLTGIQPMPPRVEAWSPNHWTTREFPFSTFLKWKLYHQFSNSLLL